MYEPQFMIRSNSKPMVSGVLSDILKITMLGGCFNQFYGTTTRKLKPASLWRYNGNDWMLIGLMPCQGVRCLLTPKMASGPWWLMVFCFNRKPLCGLWPDPPRCDFGQPRRMCWLNHKNWTRKTTQGWRADCPRVLWKLQRKNTEV